MDEIRGQVVPSKHSTVAEIITPKVAAAYLEKKAPNRRLDMERIAQYKKDILSGAFDHTHQGISFNSKGELNDGQNRLFAIAQAGVPVVMNVTRGMDAIKAVDTGKNRSFKDAATYVSEWQDITVDGASIARYIYMMTTRVKKISNSDIEITYRKFEKGITFAVEHCKRRLTGITNRAFKTVIAAAYYTQDHKRLAEFCEVVYTGVPMSNADLAALRLRERPSHDEKVTYRLTTSALRHFLANKELKRLVESDMFFEFPN